jgi:putrescine transport system ATP-binding protein
MTGKDSAPFIEIQNVSKYFGDFAAVDSVSLKIGKGELFSILGGSGCGKTTLLRMLAGFESPTNGRILIDGVDVTDQPPYERPVNMMFQSYAIFPHMSVEKNVAYGLEKDRVPTSEITTRVGDLEAHLHLAARQPIQQFIGAIFNVGDGVLNQQRLHAIAPKSLFQ